MQQALSRVRGIRPKISYEYLITYMRLEWVEMPTVIMFALGASWAGRAYDFCAHRQILQSVRMAYALRHLPRFVCFEGTINYLLCNHAEFWEYVAIWPDSQYSRRCIGQDSRS